MNEDDTAGVIAPPPLIYAGPLVVGLLLNRVFPRPFLPAGVARPLGMTLIGLSFLFWPPAIMAMRRRQTSVLPDVPTTAIVTDGPFRYSRNPIYLSFTLLYAGIASFRNALWAIALLPAVLRVMRQGVIEREERYLARKFGAEYVRYTRQVRRWM